MFVWMLISPGPRGHGSYLALDVLTVAEGPRLFTGIPPPGVEGLCRRTHAQLPVPPGRRSRSDSVARPLLKLCQRTRTGLDCRRPMTTAARTY